MTPPLPCPHHAACGGCAWMSTSLDTQLERKVADLSKRLNRPVDQVVPSPRSVGYRARMRLRVDATGRAGYRRPRTHTHVPIPACAIARPELNDVLGRLPLLPGLEAFELRSDGQRVVLAATSGGRGKAPARLRALLEGLDLVALGLAGVALDGRVLVGDARVHLTVGGHPHALSPGSFYQVNLEVNQVLVDTVGTMVSALGPASVLDLYAGAGNLSLGFAAQGVKATLIEFAGSAARDARRTIAAHGLPAEMRTSDAGRFRAGDAFFDVAVLDPPRAGAPGVIDQLLTTRPRAVVYVSCNPSALARDLRPAKAAGYTLTHLGLFDMFPHTPHSEALAVLQRTGT